ncbi:hypothetical protein CPB84DRAFT_1843947 [Gymnopilus junonius]|uniref:Uncharacterized protein n=1 Tax=Gymnopilus junonius TaxID=109634 RepID=A0A9P5TQR1_GYMJU|nr:hypothetical protein CPB84DRAFT_1843947 [Gymnopilus junonius]
MGYSFLVTNAHNPAVLISACLFYIFLTTVLALAPFYWIPYFLIKSMDVNERGDVLMDIDGEPTMENATPAQQDSGKLPFPKLGSDGSVKMEYLDIHSLRWPELVDLCRQFQITHSSMNMATLRSRLKDFSSREDLWNRLKVGARRAHLGPRSNKDENKAAVQKRSTKRCEVMFKDNPAIARKPLTALAAGQQLGWNEAQHKADMDWAIRISTKYLYYPEETRLQLAAHDAEHLSTPAAQNSLMKQSIESTNLQLARLIEHITASPSQPVITSTAHHVPLSMLSDVSMTSKPSATTSDLPGTAPAPSPAMLPPIFAQDEGLAQPTRTLTLGNGRKLVFTADDIPSPPAVSFAHDIPTLNKMWDDTSEHWDNNSQLWIKGIPIPIIYWKDIYTSKPNVNWKPRQWKGIKGKCFNWKVLVHRYHEGTPDQFWASFSEDGHRLGCKAILSWLSDERKMKNKALVEQIKAEYGDCFTEVFCYKKNGKIYVKSRDCDIVKQYYKEKGIVQDEEEDEADEGSGGDE